MIFAIERAPTPAEMMAALLVTTSRVGHLLLVSKVQEPRVPKQWGHRTASTDAKPWTRVNQKKKAELLHTTDLTKWGTSRPTENIEAVKERSHSTTKALSRARAGVIVPMQESIMSAETAEAPGATALSRV